MEFGLDKSTIDKIKAVFRKYPKIEKVIIYGSRAVGNYKSGSDIDLAVLGDFEWDFIGKLAEALDNTSIPYIYDLTDYARISNSDLKKHIDDEGKIFYEV